MQCRPKIMAPCQKATIQALHLNFCLHFRSSSSFSILISDKTFLLWWYAIDIAPIKRYCPFCFYGCLRGGKDSTSVISLNSLFICLYVLLSVYLSDYPCVCLSFCLSVPWVNQRGYNSLAIETHLHATSLVFCFMCLLNKVLSLALSQPKNSDHSSINTS